MFNLPVQSIPQDDLSDIAFLDRFNIDHFPWHDDVFELGRCARWGDQYGRRQRFKYPPDTQGYGLEFLQFHNDLLRAYDRWAAATGRPPCRAWSSGRNHSAYILKYAFGGPWGLGGNNGKPLDPAVFAPDLLDPKLNKFRTAAELGSFLERCGVMWHGTGHVENCDIRDVYSNNYSVRFVGWHASIDVLFEKLKDLGRPLYDESLPLDAPIPPDPGMKTYCEHFTPSPEMHGFGMKPFTGTWLYRSFYHDPDPKADPGWFVAEMHLQQHDEHLKGEIRTGDPAYRYALTGHIDQRNLSYQLTPDWFDERLIVVLTAVGATKETAGQEFQYRAYYPAAHPGQKGVRSLVGCVTQVRYPPDPTREGRTGSFFAIPLPAPHPKETAMATTHTVNIYDDGFEDLADAIKVGDSVKWVNNGSNTHTATRTDSPFPFNTGNTASGGESKPIVFTQASDHSGFAYYCHHHREMQSAIYVEAGTSRSAAPVTAMLRASDPTYPDLFRGPVVRMAAVSTTTGWPSGG